MIRGLCGPFYSLGFKAAFLIFSATSAGTGGITTNFLASRSLPSPASFCRRWLTRLEIEDVRTLPSNLENDVVAVRFIDDQTGGPVFSGAFQPRCLAA